MSTERKKSNRKPDRLEYLNLLVEEFRKTKSQDAKHQVLANLANFAYDPYNYKYIQKLGIVDVFLNCLSAADETVIQFSIGGLCNLCLDQANKKYILENNGVKKIAGLLDSQNVDILIPAITTLMYLVVPESKDEITGASVVERVTDLSGSCDARLKNLAEIFLQDYCTGQQEQQQKQEQQTAAEEEQAKHEGNAC